MDRNHLAWAAVAVALATLGGRALYREVHVDPIAVTAAIPVSDTSSELCPGVALRSARLATGSVNPSVEITQAGTDNSAGWRVEKPALPSFEIREEATYECRVSGRVDLTFGVYVNVNSQKLQGKGPVEEPEKLNLGVPGSGSIGSYQESGIASWTCGNRLMLVSLDLDAGRSTFDDLKALAEHGVKRLKCEELK